MHNVVDGSGDQALPTAAVKPAHIYVCCVCWALPLTAYPLAHDTVIAVSVVPFNVNKLPTATVDASNDIAGQLRPTKKGGFKLAWHSAAEEHSHIHTRTHDYLCRMWLWDLETMQWFGEM